jgi:luciferase family oxidoreductase group 1
LAARDGDTGRMVPLSVLDLVPITEGSTAADALGRSLDLARYAQRLGFTRYWVAEHHNMPGVGSAATAVVIAHLAGGTSTLRVGAGGIMLPNHAPLMVAEQFGTLESLFPGRIDLGLGRAPGTDQETARALRRTLGSNPDAFPDDVLELMAYLTPRDGQRVRAVPGAGLKVPIYILGSSLFGAHVAATLGLPFAFASHFAPALMVPAVERYRMLFRPSRDHPRPYVILGANIVAAETRAKARWLATSGRQAFANLRAGRPTTLPPPSKEFEKDVETFGAVPLEQVGSVSMVGDRETVRAGLEAFVAMASPDEVMVVSHIYAHAARIRSYEIVASLGTSENNRDRDQHEGR